jgi:pimeloyl-ACP methyl ester carboxylesterase
MPEALDPTGNPVEIEGVVLRTPGLEGYAEAHLPGSLGLRAAEETTPAFERAMESEGLSSEESIELNSTNEIDVDVPGMRSTAHAEPAIEMEVAAPSASWGQLVLASDEAGVLTWNFAMEDTGSRLDPTRGGGRRTYVIRRYVAHPESGGSPTRGLIGAVGKKILKVIAFKLLDPVGAVVGDYFAGKWEAAKRPYRFRSFTPDDYRSNEAGGTGSSDWEALGRGRALLMIHGTASRTHTAFGALPVEVVAELHRLYQGRVFAFDHFTLSQDPRKNLDWFCSNLPDGQDLDVDIVCHSRGGLVGRLLAERQSEFSLGSRRLRVGRIVFVAVPNSGTILADTRYMNDFVDSYANLLNFLPDTGIVEGFEAVITVAKQLAVGAVKGLDGLQSMNPGGRFLRSLNVGPASGTRYYALAADYEPGVPGFKAYALDRLTDKIFKETNDLVVPTGGVYGKNGGGGFPIDEKYVFEPAAGVGHTNFFAQRQVHEKILEWLSAE